MSSHKAPSGYQPTGQGAADTGYQNATSSLAQAGQNLSSTTIPGFQGVTSAMQNNPYYTQAQTGADSAAQMGRDVVAPWQFGGAAADMNLGNQAGANASTAWGQSQQAYAAAMGLLPQMMTGFNTTPDLMTGAQKTAGQLNAAIPGATGGFDLGRAAWDQSQALMPLTTANLGAAQQILNTGFDPQQALYDRSYQQMQEHQNAINAQNGVSGSPFAAGVSGDASRNFDIDWQNAQLGRQTQALGAFDGAMSTDAGNFSTLMGAGSGAYNSLVNGATSNLRGLAGDANTALFNAAQGEFGNRQASMNDATQRYASMLGIANNTMSSGTNAFNGLGATQQNAYATGSDLGATGLNTLSTAAQLPNDIYAQNQAQILQALQAQVQGTNASMDLTQNAVGDYGNYMKIGQGATQLAQSAAQINNAASAAQWQGIGQLAGLAMAPFTGGASLMGMAGQMAKSFGGGASSVAGNPAVLT